MNWNWACEQLLKGKKVKLPDYGIRTYLFLNIEGILCSNILSHEEEYAPCNREFLSTDWELYQEPKKWTKEDIRMAKAGIELGLKWVARGITGYVDMYEKMPTKNDVIQAWGRKPNTNHLGCSSDLFLSVKWEDEEPTRLQDIVDSEKENYNE